MLEPLFGDNKTELEERLASGSVLLGGGSEGMLVGHLNIRSVLPKHDELQVLLERCGSMVLGLSETWLDGTIMDAEVGTPGFKIFRRDRNRRGGGVMVYVSEQFKTVRREDLEDDAVEACIVDGSQGKECDCVSM